MKTRLLALLSRKFIGFETVALSATLSFWFFGLEGNLYRDIMIADIGILSVLNVWQKKVTEAKP